MLAAKYNVVVKQYHSLRRIGLAASTCLTALLMLLGLAWPASAACADPNQQSCSSSYGVSETYFGTGGTLCDPSNPSVSEHSTNYCAKTAVGESGVGNTLGTAYQAQAGFNTNREPSLAVLINDSQCPDYDSTNGASRSVGTLSAASTKFTNVNFSVMSYLASSYAVYTHGQRPTYNGVPSYTLASTNGNAPATGTEGFGMNLRQDVNPATGSGNVGSDVVQIPNVTFGFGQVSSGTGASNNYNNPGHYTYNDGDKIAFSNKSSGITCYDATYVFDIQNTTPAGQYTFNQSIVVTSTY